MQWFIVHVGWWHDGVVELRRGRRGRRGNGDEAGDL